MTSKAGLFPGCVSGLQTDKVIELGALVVAVCAVSFGPFVLAGGPSQLGQIISRLFPFQRGLNHAYWAGNVWALYTGVDRILVKCERFSYHTRPVAHPRLTYSLL